MYRSMASLPRLYVDHPLAPGQSVPLERDQAHYLFSVMRLSEGAGVILFNGRDGEWLAEVSETGKRGGTLSPREQTGGQGAPPDLTLLFAPVKKARTDFIVEKAVEMGVARLQPVLTEFTNSERVRQDRLQAHAVEAAEQCGATWVPEVGEVRKLDAVLGNWTEDRQLGYCDEALATGAGGGFPDGSASWAILIGPEGGLSDTERSRLAALPFAHPIRLGPRILRADTAAVAALTLWQSTLGDWQ